MTADRSELERVIARDDATLLRALVKGGLSIDDRVEFDQLSLLEFAGLRGALRCVRALLELGATASPDALAIAGYGAPSPDGDDRERYRQHVEVVRVLLDAGVDASAANRDGVPARMALDDAGPEMAALAEPPSRRE